MQTQSLTIPIEFPSLNEVVSESKRHWGRYSSMKKELTTVVAALARKKLKPVETRVPDDTPRSGRRAGVCHRVHIQLDWYSRERRKDPDNLAASKKFVLDGLVKAGILQSDGWKWIAGFTDRFYVSRDNPRVEVILMDSFNGTCYTHRNTTERRLLREFASLDC